ncbi:hypothetical protein [Pyruvatibacter mobilis]|uniref:hypothetical protein n=1 Tax=Pyruvatibacter mobilis TaxID=1712261 RepID=UPI003BAB1F51
MGADEFFRVPTTFFFKARFARQGAPFSCPAVRLGRTLLLAGRGRTPKAPRFSAEQSHFAAQQKLEINLDKNRTTIDLKLPDCLFETRPLFHFV